MTLADTEARRRIRDDHGATFVVEAAAGTGKTTMLVARIVALLRAGAATLDRIVAVTFTEKAAGEMKLRLRAEIERARTADGAAPEERARLEGALRDLELARIGTIHGFCADLLRERPIEARVDPLFAVAPEDESGRMLDAAFDAWFEVALAAPPEGLRRMLRRRPPRRDGSGPRQRLREAVASLAEHRDFDAPWRREPFAREPALDRMLERLGELAPLAARAERRSTLARNLEEIARFAAETRSREAVRGRDYDALEAALVALARDRSWRWVGSGRSLGAGLLRADVLALRDAVRDELDALVRALDADLAPLLRDALWPVVRAYEEHKHRAGALDFVDLLLRTRDLIRDDAAMRAEWQRRFDRFFVDEFQDTDPLQAEILLLLAADDPAAGDWREVRVTPGKLFLVGDPKQSIYRFRRADVAIYQAVKRRLLAQGAELLELSTSFRAVPSLQQAVNAAFAPALREAETDGQAGYVALQPFRPETAGRPSLIALPVPRPYGDYGSIARFRIDESLPDAVGALVHWLVASSGWRVHERDGAEPAPLAARHICLLFRRFHSFGQDVTRPYVRALEARRMPHVLVGGRSFHEREEVLALRNALVAIEWPDDELRVFAALRGPLVALGDDALLAFRARHGRLHPLRRMADADLADDDERAVADALSLLARLHGGRNRRPIARTLERLLAATRAHAGIANWKTGEQALANALRVVDLARRFERRGAPSFRAFVERMEDDAERGAAEDAPVVEEGTEGVRIMTVHRAKGLEFPVVILCDPTCRATRDEPSRWVDPERRLWVEPLCGCAPPELAEHAELELARDRAEALRLAYVAATRARDLLVVPVVGDPAPPDVLEGWLSALHPAVYPEPARRRAAAAAPGCPAFGADSVLERTDRAETSTRDSVQPGLHAPIAGEHRVVWWDPAALELDAVEEVGLRQQRLLEADESGANVESSRRAHEAWQASRRRALEVGAAPELRVATATALAVERAAAGAPEIAVADTGVERAGRPAGRRFGTLVHASLAAMPFDAGPGEIQRISALCGRLVGASEAEVAACAIAVRAALAHPLLARASRASDVRRETPLLHALPDGRLCEGVVDLAFREANAAGGARWTVVDFKTDRELGEHRATYAAQVSLYAEAIAAATGEPAEGVLLVV